MRRLALHGTLGLLLGALVPAGIAHEDDPKLLDLQRPYRGTGYRAARAGSGGGSLAGGVEFASDGVTLLSWMPLGEFGSPANGADCWGYVSSSGREYAIFGHYDGTSFVEVTQPDDPQLVATVNGPDSLWRDIKVYQDHAYAVSEGGSGIQVMDLGQIDSGLVTHVGNFTAGGSSATHNVAIDTVSGYLYRTGGSDNGLRIYSLADPASPSFVGSWSDRYVHDAQVITYTSGPYAGKQIAFCCSGFNGGWTSPGISILDVTNKSNIVQLSQFQYPNPKYSHQAWLNEDGTLLYLNDELDESGSFPTTTYIIDV